MITSQDWLNAIEKTEKKEFIRENILFVEVGTTGYRGGDTGHGGRTYLKLQDMSSTDMRVRIDGENWVHMMSSHPLEIAFGGDAELDTLIDALDFAVDTLKKQRSLRWRP